MLRITKKERQQLYNLNARIRRKIKNLKTTFNINTNFEITTPSQFLTRREVNFYKVEAKKFLSPYTHNYVRLGIKRGSPYYFYVTRQEYNETMRVIRRQNAYARRLMEKVNKIPLTESGQNQAISVGAFIKTTAPKIKREGLRSPYAQFFPIKFEKSSIRSREQFEKFTTAVKGFHTAKAYKKINTQAQRNFITALENTFGTNAEPLIKLISQLSGNEFLEFYESDVNVDFDYIYDPATILRVLKNVSNAFLRWLSNSEEFRKRKYISDEFVELTDEIKKTINLDSATILSDLTINFRSFTDPSTGKRYTGIFRAREAQMIDKGNITPDILRKSKEINIL